MWDLKFWTFFALTLILAGIIAKIRRLRFIDIQIMLMIAALALACDMLFCKQFKLYSYINIEYKGWYSFWANLFVIPVWGLTFIKFVPKSFKGAALYIALWTMISTIFELLVIKPLGIVLYFQWKIIPYSVIGYILLLVWIYIYYRILLGHYGKEKTLINKQ